MHRRNILAGLAGLGIGALAYPLAKCTPADAGMPIPHAELKRLWQVAKLADDAADLMRKAPSSWGGLPWSFEGPVQFHDPERLETVRVRIVAVHDQWTDGPRDARAPGHWLHVDYQVTEPVRVRKNGTRTFYKGNPVRYDDSEADPE